MKTRQKLKTNKNCPKNTDIISKENTRLGVFVMKNEDAFSHFKISEPMHKKLTGNLNILTKANLIKA